MPAACRRCSGACRAERPSGVKLGVYSSPGRVRFWANRTSSRHRQMTESGPQAVFGSIPLTCLSALVTDRAMEAWYHASIA
jgi:hypothetical protein